MVGYPAGGGGGGSGNVSFLHIVSIRGLLLTSLVAEMEKEILKGSCPRAVEIEEGLLNGMFGTLDLDLEDLVLKGRSVGV